MGARGLKLAVLAALLLAGWLSWWGLRSTPAAGPPDQDARQADANDAELVRPAARAADPAAPAVVADEPQETRVAETSEPVGSEASQDAEPFRGRVVDVVTRGRVAFVAILVFLVVLFACVTVAFAVSDLRSIAAAAY